MSEKDYYPGFVPQAVHLTTGTVYKVWLDIEEYDIEDGSGELEPGGGSTPCLATFATEEAAQALCDKIYALFHEAEGQVSHD